MKTIMDSFRQTGRTTKLLKEAMTLAASNSFLKVYYVVCYSEQIKILQDGHLPYVKLITYEKALELKLVNDGLPSLEKHKDTIVFIDHSVIENIYSKQLEILFQSTDFIRLKNV